MATLQQLYNVYEGNNLYHEVRSAILIACHKILVEPPITADHQTRVAFARQVLMNPDTHVKAFYGLVLASAQSNNPNITSNQLRTLVDADIQASVDAAFDKLFGVP